jgi:hypothetical protein
MADLEPETFAKGDFTFLLYHQAHCLQLFEVLQLFQVQLEGFKEKFNKLYKIN